MFQTAPAAMVQASLVIDLHPSLKSPIMQPERTFGLDIHISFERELAPKHRLRHDIDTNFSFNSYFSEPKVAQLRRGRGLINGVDERSPSGIPCDPSSLHNAKPQSQPDYLSNRHESDNILPHAKAESLKEAVGGALRVLPFGKTKNLDLTELKRRHMKLNTSEAVEVATNLLREVTCPLLNARRGESGFLTRLINP